MVVEPVAITLLGDEQQLGMYATGHVLHIGPVQIIRYFNANISINAHACLQTRHE